MLELDGEVFEPKTCVRGEAIYSQVKPHDVMILNLSHTPEWLIVLPSCT